MKPGTRGMFFSVFSGVFLFLGLGILLGWSLPEWPFWLVFIGAHLVVVALVVIAWFSLNADHRVTPVLAALLLCLAGAIEVAFLGISIDGLTIVEGIPSWPRWVAIVLTVVGGMSLVQGIDYFNDEVANRRLEADLARRR